MDIEDSEEEIIGDVKAARTLLRIARDRLLEAMNLLKVDDGIEERAKKINSFIESYEKAAHKAIEAERRFAKFGKTIAPISGGTFDLDSAKRDVVERLARIAAARGD